MSEFEEIRKLIGQIDPDKNGLATITRMSRVCRYAGVYVEFLRANDETRSGVYRKAVDRITSLYEPAEDYAEAYTPHIHIPATFEDICDFMPYAKDLTGFMEFPAYFATWKKLEN